MHFEEERVSDENDPVSVNSGSPLCPTAQEK